jgi:hypothetical protein
VGSVKLGPRRSAGPVRMVRIPEETTGGGSGYDHLTLNASPPVEGRGKPVATRPGILGALAASVTGLQTVNCIYHLGSSLFPVESGYGHSLPGLVSGSARALACGG